MIYENNMMRLICIEGKGEKVAKFVTISTNELIIAHGVVWEEGNKVYWNAGQYMGPIANYIKID